MRKILIGLGALTLIAMLAAIVLWLAEHPIAAAIVGTATVALWLVLVVMGTVAVTSWWTRGTMRAGADIALQSQNVNDQWDARKTAAFATLAKAMIGLGQSGGRNLPALPLPSQDAGEWLPSLTEFEAQDVIEMED